MTPVFQTIISDKQGNCMQAAIASLLDLPLESVPHFVSFGHKWFESFWKFIEEAGYEYHGAIRNPRDFGSWGEDRMGKIAETSPGLDGLYYGVVYSPTFADFNNFRAGKSVTSHAVIIDAKCNIIHDPNPNNAGITEYPGHQILDYNGVTQVYMIEKKT